MTAASVGPWTSLPNYGSPYMPLSLRLSVLIVLLPVALPCAYGQQPDTTQLPEIAPREIEIRGERQIALPSLERQPLTGFSSPTRIPSVPSDHRPYVGSYQQPLDDLPESLPVPETVSEPMQPAADPARGLLEGGSGRYFSRFLEGRVGLPLSATERISVHGTYTGTEADPNDDVAEGRVRFESTRENVRVSAEGYGAAQRYALYGATLSSIAAPERDGYTGGGAVRLQTTGRLPTRAEVRYDHAQYTSALDTTTTTNSVFSQQQLDLNGSGTLPLPLRPHLNAQYRRSWFGGDPQDGTAFSLDAGGRLTLFRDEASTVEVGARVLTFETPARVLSPPVDTASATYAAPSVRVEWQVADGARLHLQNRPRLGDTSLDQLYATNPFAEHAPTLQPTLETTNAEAGLTLSYGSLRIVTAGGYRYAPIYRYFSFVEQNNALSRRSGLYRVRYDPARIVQARSQIALQGIDGVQAAAGVTVRDGRLPTRDLEIPNFAPVTANAMLAVSFAGGDGFVEAQGYFESPRYAGTAQNDRLGSYFTLDLEGSYALSSHLDVVARAENLSVEAPTRWKNYPRPPAQIKVGLRLRW